MQGALPAACSSNAASWVCEGVTALVLFFENKSRSSGDVTTAAGGDIAKCGQQSGNCCNVLKCNVLLVQYSSTKLTNGSNVVL
jgi:hypothetical protein